MAQLSFRKRCRDCLFYRYFLISSAFSLWYAEVCSFVHAATFPLDLVRRRMQLEGAAGNAPVYKSGVMGTFVHIRRTEGWRGLYRGILPEYLKVVPSVGIVFMTYEFMKSRLSSE